MAIGTYDYMAPEQALNKQVDGRTDIYSMGITLYEMLTGDVPFQCDSELAVQMAHLNERPRNPIECNPAIPESVADVVLRALEKDPANRFATTEEFIRALPRLSDASGQMPRQTSPGSGTVIDTEALAGCRRRLRDGVRRASRRAGLRLRRRRLFRLRRHLLRHSRYGRSSSQRDSSRRL